MFKKYKLICKRLKKDYKQDLYLCIGMLIINLLLFIALASLVSLTSALISLIIYMLFLYFHFSTLIRKYNVLTYKKQKAFIIVYKTIISYMKITCSLIESIKSALNVCDEVLIDDLNELLLDLENDFSLEMFLKFSDNFEDDNIKTMVLYLHKLTLIDNLEYTLFNVEEYSYNLKDNSNKLLIKEKVKIMDYYRFIPLILSSLSVIIIFAFVFSSIGEIISG